MRIDVMKTYKLFINGNFPRSESGRVYEILDSKGKFLANPCNGSRKDLRESVVAARSAHSGWASATAFNRGQVLYRVAEIMQGRIEQFVAEIVAQEGATPAAAKIQVQSAIDTWVWYAGWCDKIDSISGSTNPVSGPFYNFSIPESLGVVAIFADSKPSLLNLVSALAPVIATGNTAILIASEKHPLCAITLGECLATSDVPAGVVNILTGKVDQFVTWVGSHMEIDGVDASGLSKKDLVEIKELGAENLKRVHSFNEAKSTKRMVNFMEIKTVWHTIGI
ncbi:MAG: aldehyde dehydrogenase family protein [Candidatus Nanopelagicaceae bacterium]